MREYVAGFLFDMISDQPHAYVALIRKNRGPANMAGSLNGIGGKIESGETPLQAMIREFNEETGALVEDWAHFCTLSGTDWRVYFFKAYGYTTIKTTTDENVDWYNVWYILNRETAIMSNLRWLIPMALDENITLAEVTDKIPQ